jgi:hypothetical protein
VLRREDLMAHEEALRAARRPVGLHGARPTRPANPRPKTARSRTEPLRPGWWRGVPRDDRDAA